MNLVKYSNIKAICLEKNVQLVAVSKTKPLEDILVLYNNGQKIFGENKVQELVGKYNKLPKDIEWHFIGHLQKNKVKQIAHFVRLIHAVDSLSLLNEIDKRAKQNGRIISCLIQFHIAKENSKFGLKIQDIENFFNAINNFKNVKIKGIMGMATFTDDTKILSREFKTLKDIFELIKENYFKNNNEFNEISMGMSGDYTLAIEEGSTMIRIGSLIFGAR